MVGWVHADERQRLVVQCFRQSFTYTAAITLSAAALSSRIPAVPYLACVPVDFLSEGKAAKYGPRQRSAGAGGDGADLVLDIDQQLVTSATQDHDERGSLTTAWWHVNEVIALFAARAPALGRALREAKNAGYAFVVVDGTLIPIDRVKKRSASSCTWASEEGVDGT